MNFASLAAVTSEFAVMAQAKKINAPPVKFTTAQLMEIAADCIPHGRKAEAEHWLRELYPDHIPASEYLDMVFGLDMVINYRGWVIGLDVTLDSEGVVQKQRKQSNLAGAYRALGLDKWGVVLAPCSDLKATLSAIIKS